MRSATQSSEKRASLPSEGALLLLPGHPERGRMPESRDPRSARAARLLQGVPAARRRGFHSSIIIPVTLSAEILSAAGRHFHGSRPAARASGAAFLAGLQAAIT